jgi:hypothetical protein
MIAALVWLVSRCCRSNNIGGFGGGGGGGYDMNGSMVDGWLKWFNGSMVSLEPLLAKTKQPNNQPLANHQPTIDTILTSPFDISYHHLCYTVVRLIEMMVDLSDVTPNSAAPYGGDQPGGMGMGAAPPGISLSPSFTLLLLSPPPLLFLLSPTIQSLSLFGDDGC